MDIKQVIHGHEYTVCYPDSWYIADKTCKEHHDDYELTCKKEGTVAVIYMSEKVKKASWFDKDDVHITTSKTQKCLGWLLWDINTDTVVLRKTQVDSELHEFHKGDCLAISYDIFKNLRDHDIIQIHGDYTDKDGKVTPMIFRIKKYKAAKLGDFKNFTGYGLQYFIPKDAFWKVEDTTKLRTKKVKRETSQDKTKKKSSDRNQPSRSQEEKTMATPDGRA